MPPESSARGKTAALLRRHPPLEAGKIAPPSLHPIRAPLKRRRLKRNPEGERELEGVVFRQQTLKPRRGFKVIRKNKNGGGVRAQTFIGSREIYQARRTHPAFAPALPVRPLTLTARGSQVLPQPFPHTCTHVHAHTNPLLHLMSEKVVSPSHKMEFRDKMSQEVYIFMWVWRVGQSTGRGFKSQA